ncbi:MAG: tRNA (N(6)-L-threonylcarbamoyladenosine(37)-C(2))-methylthiotransferase [Candidatus Pacearchaeota archaeon]|nr:tRNA (N(6)-L-threonylcarbamoyladenosine(37)-C(2))-methylthiotransferase [Candidatus Pacearchaeota archaeon]
MIKHIYLETYGCTANQNNTELIKARLVESGLDLVQNEKLADISIVNTCIVKSKTENKVISRIKALSYKPVIVTGCIVPVRIKELANRKNVFLLSMNNLKDIPKLVKKIQENSYKVEDFNSSNREVKLGRKINANRLIGITQISEGCLGNCSFCITKTAKGRLFSFPEERIIKQVEQDLENGCKEIWLTSQDNASYMLDSGKPRLIELLENILDLKGNFKLRLGMMNPENILLILDELIESYKHKKMYKFLHIPVQSGSDKILKDMNRKYKVRDFLKIISKFRKEIPEITISTDIIAGYPTETREDFQQTLELVKEVKPDIINNSRFWPRKGTLAATLPQLDDKIQRQRTTTLADLYKNMVKEKNSVFLATIQEVLITEKQGDLYFGRNPSYKRVVVFSKNNLFGKNIKVKIKEAKAYYLVGEEV